MGAGVLLQGRPDSSLRGVSGPRPPYGTFTSEFLDVRVCWTVLYPQGEYVGLSYILKALFTNNRGGYKTVQHCLTYSNIILTKEVTSKDGGTISVFLCSSPLFSKN